MRLFICAFLLCFSASSTLANNDSEKDSALIKTMGISAISGISSALSQADVALCKSMIFPSHLKGDYGETIAGKFYLEHHLKKSGSWRPVSARLNSQGIDLIYLKHDKLGRLRDIMVGEVKYGSSKLATTKDGIQMGKQWTQKRLVALGNRYIDVASYQNIQRQKRPSKLVDIHQIEIDLKNGKKVVFWRKDGKSLWRFEGRPEDLSLAQTKAQTTGQFIKKAGQYVIRVRRRIFEIKTDKNFLSITIKDAKHLDSGISQAKIKGQTFHIRLSGAFGKLSNMALSKAIAKQLKRKVPLFSDNECRDYAAKSIVKEKTNVEDLNISKNSYPKSVLATSLKAGIAGTLFAVAFEGISQSISGHLDYQRLFETGALGFVSVSAGTALGQQATTYGVRSKVTHSAMTKAASSLGMRSTPFLGNHRCFRRCRSHICTFCLWGLFPWTL